METNVLISGASIAGPALAHWLLRAGARVCVVERAPALRPGGQAVDFRGAAHLGVLERMNLIDAIRSERTRMGETVIVDADGKPKVRLPSVFMSGELEIERGALSRILFDATKDRAEYRFGDSIAQLHERADGVDVRFESGRSERFDLVIGADGLHSRVRELALGPESRFWRFHGYYVAVFDAPNELGLVRETRIFSVPKLSVSVSSAQQPDRARVMFVFASKERDLQHRDLERQKQIIEAQYANVGWKVPQLLSSLRAAPELYFDAIARVDVPHYARGRVALLGDAAWGGTLGGQGTGLAIVGARVLAGELVDHAGDHRAAFAQYETRMRAYATDCQQGAKRVGPFYAPQTGFGLWLRDRAYGLLSSPPLERLLERIVTSSARGFCVPEYEAL